MREPMGRRHFSKLKLSPVFFSKLKLSPAVFSKLKLSPAPKL